MLPLAVINSFNLFQADCKRLEEFYNRIDYLPLGSGALAGNPFKIDRLKLARILGFVNVTPNSMHAVADRDFVGKIGHLFQFLTSKITNVFAFQLNSISLLR
jgi:argininosuccinate lyase